MNDIANHLTAILTAAGVKVFRMESDTTESIYLKIDYGVCNTIRIADHYGKRCRYNIGPYVKHFRVERGRYDRYYYQSKRMGELSRRILRDRKTLLQRYGRRNYHRYMAMNKEKYHECK